MNDTTQTPPVVRDPAGRFASGTCGGPGNPHVKQVARFRTAVLEAIKEEDIQAVVSRLVELAKAGESWAVKELLDRTCGKPRPTEDEPDNEKVEIIIKRVDMTTSGESPSH